MDVITLLLAYFISVNLIGFFLMGLDKYKAKKNLWRIPESTLFIIAIIGGSIGCIIGMHTFRHKRGIGILFMVCRLSLFCR